MGMESDGARVRESEGFEGKGEKSGIGGFDTDFDGGTERGALEDGGERRGIVGETEGAELVAESGEVGFE